MYNIGVKRKEENKMKREVIKKITDVETSTLNDLYFMSEMYGITIHKFLEHVDGRNFIFRKNGNDTTLIRRKYYNDIKSYGEYSSVGFTSGM